MATQVNRAMISETSICNQALGWLGEKPINSLEEGTVNAELCRENYPFIRDAVIEERMWSFAMVRAKSITAERDEWDTMYKHAMPIPWLNVFRVYRSVTPNARRRSDNWVKEGEYILTKEDTVYLWGVKRITDTGKFTNMFVQCLAERLAADLCIPITENVTLQGVRWQLYGAKLAEASVRDGQQGANEEIQSNTLIDARSGGGFSGV
jgi:hypothetical protein